MPRLYRGVHGRNMGLKSERRDFTMTSVTSKTGLVWYGLIWYIRGPALGMEIAARFRRVLDVYYKYVSSSLPSPFLTCCDDR